MTKMVGIKNSILFKIYLAMLLNIGLFLLQTYTMLAQGHHQCLVNLFETESLLLVTWAQRSGFNLFKFLANGNTLKWRK